MYFNNFLFYFWGIVFKPQVALKKLSKDVNLTKYLLVLVVVYYLMVLVGLGFSEGKIPIQGNNNMERLVSEYLNLLFSTLYIFRFLPIWIVYGFSVFLISRLFSKKGSALVVIVALGFIGIAFGVSNLILALFNKLPSVVFIRYAFFVWVIYLDILAVSVLTAVSKLKAFLILMTIFILVVILFFLGMILYVGPKL